MTTADLELRQDVRLKTDKGEIAKGWISKIQEYPIHRPVVLEDGTRTGDYIPETGQLFTVTFHQDRFNEQTSSEIIGREFYRQALLNAMEAAEEKGG